MNIQNKRQRYSALSSQCKKRLRENGIEDFEECPVCGSGEIEEWKADYWSEEWVENIHCWNCGLKHALTKEQLKKIPGVEI